ncbi:hypothetical protein M405DRAFT_848215, partial [Rhizopogon salebrosus TDB-379]
MMGCAVLPHLRNLVACIAHGLQDEQQKSFDEVLKPLWLGLAAFLKVIGFIIPLMDPEYAFYYTKEVTVILVREFQTSDEEMKKIVLKVVKQCAATEGVTPQYIKHDILPEFFESFWVRRMALDRRDYRQVVEMTVELARKAGVSAIVGRIVNDLKDEAEPYQKMEQVTGDQVMLDGFGAVVNALHIRVKPYLTQIVSTVLLWLNNKSTKECGEEILLSKLGLVLFEQLGEKYPDTLSNIIAAEGAIANVVGMTQMNPPVKDLLPRMTPILRNRHEK